MVAPQTLMRAHADYAALGHIHLRQEIMGNMVYSGSAFNKNWGETDAKSFEIVEFETFPAITVNHFPVYFTNARPMVKVAAVLQEDGELAYEEYEAIEGAEYRVRISIHETLKLLYTETLKQSLRLKFGDDVKIEDITIPVQRDTRSETIMDCKDLKEEVVEYNTVVKEETTPGMITKVFQVMRECA
jgi:DNA repair exonuclease SbcCD nuclease subunit